MQTLKKSGCSTTLPTATFSVCFSCASSSPRICQYWMHLTAMISSPFSRWPAVSIIWISNSSLARISQMSSTVRGYSLLNDCSSLVKLRLWFVDHSYSLTRSLRIVLVLPIRNSTSWLNNSRPYKEQGVQFLNCMYLQRLILIQLRNLPNFMRWMLSSPKSCGTKVYYTLQSNYGYYLKDQPSFPSYWASWTASTIRVNALAQGAFLRLSPSLVESDLDGLIVQFESNLSTLKLAITFLLSYYLQSHTVSLSYIRRQHSPLMNSFISQDIPVRRCMGNYRLAFLQTAQSWWLVAPGQGNWPVFKQKRVMPTANESVLREQRLWMRVSGGMQRGLPILNFYFKTVPGSSMKRAKPKSPSIHRLCLRKMLAGLISRWMIRFSLRYWQPSRMALKISLKICSLFCFSEQFQAFYFYLSMLSSKNCCKFPPSQQSVTIQQLFCVQQTSWKRRTLGWLRELRILISFLSSAWLAFLMECRLTTFIAQTLLLSYLWQHLQTSLLNPLPMLSFRQKQYSPIFFLELCTTLEFRALSLRLNFYLESCSLPGRLWLQGLSIQIENNQLLKQIKQPAPAALNSDSLFALSSPTFLQHSRARTNIL